MQINNITNCHKPKNFTGLKDTARVRYKHYQEMPEEVLQAHSMLKAYKDVKESNKFRLLQAVPAITSTLIATSLALTQPGKLSTKVTKGVGFLVALNGISFVANKMSKITDKIFIGNKENKEEKPFAGFASDMTSLLSSAALIIGAASLVSKNKTEILSTKAGSFIKSEAEKLVNEINNTKLAQKVENSFNPFMEKHKEAFLKASHIAPLGLIGAQSIANNKLSKSLSKDFLDKTVQNYTKGKTAQKDAREHFNSIDAIEV